MFYVTYNRGFIDVFSKRATGFHSWGKRFQLNFSVRTAILKIVKFGSKNHSHSQSIFPVPMTPAHTYAHILYTPMYVSAYAYPHTELM